MNVINLPMMPFNLTLAIAIERNSNNNLDKLALIPFEKPNAY